MEVNEIKNPATSEKAIKKKPIGWFIAAVICSLLSVKPAEFVYSQWQNINEFTLLVTIIPVLIAIVLCILTLHCWFIHVQVFSAKQICSPPTTNIGHEKD